MASGEAGELYRELAEQRHRLLCLEVVEQAEAIVRQGRESMLHELAEVAGREVDTARRELVALMSGHDLVAIMAAEEQLCRWQRRLDDITVLLWRHREVCGAARSAYAATRSQVRLAIARLAKQLGELDPMAGLPDVDVSAAGRECSPPVVPGQPPP